MKNLLMTTIAIFGLATNSNAQVPNYVPSDGLVGWWPFNGNANDESGSNNNGTVNGAILTTDRFGIANKAFDFIGSSSRIELQPNSNIQGNNSRSISFWFKLTSENVNDNIIYKGGNNGDGNDFSILIKVVANNNYIIMVRRYNDDVFSDEIALSLNQWNYYSIIYDGTVNSNIKIFINGNEHFGRLLVGSGLTFNTSSTSPEFGHMIDQLDVDYYLNGTLDDIGIWNRALTQEEITSLYYGSSLYANEVSQSNLFSVFPNPAQNVINVKLDAKLLGSVFTIYDNIGKAVKTGKLNSLNTTIDLIDLSSGIYTFNLGENRKQNFKVIKE